VGSGEYYICVIAYANGTGKTACTMAMLANLIWGMQSEYFDYPLFQKYPARWPKSFRIISESELVDDSGPIQREIKSLWPRGRYTWEKGGKAYHRLFHSDNGWLGEVMTYEQEVSAFEGKTRGVNIFVEPPPRAIFNACIARQRMGGLNILDMTPLTRSAWIKDEIVDVPFVEINGQQYGRAICLHADIEDNCAEHGINGLLNHSDILQMVSRYDAEEVEARAHGQFMHLSGRVYKTYSKETHEINELAGYHMEMLSKKRYTLYNIVDPHDRKPFAIGWYAVLPNDDVICLAEYPDTPFHKILTSDLQPTDYAGIIRATETELGKAADVRLIDPNFGNAPKLGGDTIKQAFEKFNLYYLDPPDKLNEGHILVRSLLGNPNGGIRPKFYVMSHCFNHSFGLSHYGFREQKSASKGPSEAPELIYKDFPDLVRYGTLWGWRFLGDIKALNLRKPKVHVGSSYRGR